MAVESVAFAVGLWVASRNLGPALNGFSVALTVAPAVPPPPAVRPAAAEAVAQVLTSVGAGIYEEVLFRLVLFTGLAWLLRRFGAGPLAATLFAAMISAVLFAVAHHLGPYGESFDNYVFVFRTVAGLYFTVLFRSRGFGVAVGAHTCYDLLVAVG
jgi:membrane protease YdiL (CAAX protease family)